MNRVALVGLIKIELPGHTLRLCDGGFFVFQGETYRSIDPVFGTIGSVENLKEGIGDTLPALSMTLLTPSTSAAAQLSQPGNQTSPVTFWLAEYDPATMQISSADVQFTGFVDQAVVVSGGGQMRIDLSIVSLAERLFEGNIGNTLNPAFHKSIWPGETGHDNATALALQVAWGTERPPQPSPASSIPLPIGPVRF